MARRSKGIPGDVEPAGAGQELVGQVVGLEEVDEALELARVLGTNVGGLAREVLRVTDSTHEGVDARVAEAGVDEDGTDHLAGGFQQILATILQVEQHLYRWQVVRVLLQIEEFCQRKMFTEFCVFHRFSW